MVLYTLYQIISVLASAFIMLVIVQFVIGLLLAFNVINQSNAFVVQIYQSINALLEPILNPIRRVLPSTGAIDFSPLVVMLIVLENAAIANL